LTIENMPTEYTVSLDEMLKAAFMGAPIANLSVRLPGTLRPFGREAKSANYKASAGTDVIRFTVSREEGEDVGEYAIKASGEATQGNYTVTFVDGKLTITNAGGDVPSPKTADTMPIALLAALLLAAFTPAALAAKKRRESAE